MTAAALLLGFLLLMKSFGPGLIKALQELMRELLSLDALSEMKVAAMGPTLMRSLAVVAQSLAPLLVGGMLIAVVLNLLQVGFFLSSKRLQPNFGALNPLQGLSRMFQGENYVHLVVNVLKLLLVAAVAYSAVQDRVEQILSIQRMEYLQAFGLGATVVYSIGLRVALLLLVLALLDYGFQKFKTERELRMTKQEVKEEMRRMEGDPKIKQRRRQIAMQMHAKRLKKDVPTADVIVTNPTHFAVALKYDAAAMRAPRVVAKGADFMAKRIREIAIEAGVPIIERKPLAQALFKLVEVGHEIPEQFYSAVAEILAYVYELSGKTKAKQPV